MKLTGFTFGVRIIKSFSIEDKLGAIIDEILYSDKSEFNEKIFPNIQSNYNIKILFNQNNKEGNRFTITPRDFIFDYNIQNSFDRELTKFLNNYVEIITKRIFKNFKIKNIARFGFVIKSILEEKDQLLKKVSDIINKCQGANDGLFLRFNVITKKPFKTSNDFVTEDYDNEIVIYNKQNVSSPFVFSIDYQKYFSPALNIIDDATQDYATFCNSVLKSFKSTYLSEENE